MHKNAQKVEWKLRAKLRATSPGCSMVKVARLDDAFFRSFLTESKPSGRSVTAAKRKEKERKERRKNKHVKTRKARRCKSFSRPETQIIDF